MDAIKDKKFSDENLISYLIYKEFIQTRRPVVESNIPYWYFQASDELDKELLRFLGGEVLVDPLLYSKALRYVRRVNNGLKYKSRGVNRNGRE